MNIYAKQTVKRWQGRKPMGLLDIVYHVKIKPVMREVVAAW